ncbi:uncharacterized protein F54H12.2-like [Diprion similis]|uniref:uncharacterized protein F54H12.2-like n=1 Tax=Diprion similis TaxID=362088 RepID=UPI001EF92CFF|nr:uncharacterized protein F54H12.2-like [Diprion similis]
MFTGKGSPLFKFDPRRYKDETTCRSNDSKLKNGSTLKDSKLRQFDLPLYRYNAKKSYLSSALWYDSEEGVSDVYDADAAGADRGFIERKRIMSNARTVDLIGHLHCDVFNQDKFLLNGVELRLRLVRSRDSFCIMEAENRHKLHILETSLLVRRVKISPGILLAHARTLAKGTAKYPVTRVEVKSFTIHAGVQAEALDNVILGQLPKRVIIGFVSNKAFNGDRQRNPFNFQNYSLNFLSLYVDGVQVPSKPLQMNFGKDDLYVDAYHTLFSVRQRKLSNSKNLAFDLTPDLFANCPSHWSLIKHGTLRVEVRFDEALKETWMLHVRSLQIFRGKSYSSPISGAVATQQVVTSARGDALTPQLQRLQGEHQASWRH